jgi:hypothetical protein
MQTVCKSDCMGGAIEMLCWSDLDLLRLQRLPFGLSSASPVQRQLAPLERHPVALLLTDERR